jgi:uncharacterized protein YhbP (UPF0306 family)
LFFASSAGLTLYWLSEVGVRHSRNLAHDGRVAAAVSAAAEGWRDIRGVQLAGRAAVLRGPEREAALALYHAKFTLGPELDPAIARCEVFAMRPNWVRLLDNRRGFGFKVELELSEEKAAT